MRPSKLSGQIGWFAHSCQSFTRGDVIAQAFGHEESDRVPQVVAESSVRMSARSSAGRWSAPSNSFRYAVAASGSPSGCVAPVSRSGVASA